MQKNVPPTVTLATVDHGDVTLPEPSWCAGHDQHVPVHRVDLSHYGEQSLFEFRGEQQWAVMLVQAPFASAPAFRTPTVYVEQAGYADSLDPTDLDALAATLIEHAVRLRQEARTLAVILAGGAL